MSIVNKMRIGFFVSGGGSNMQAVFDACNDGRLNMQPAMVISNHARVKAVERAEVQGVPTYHISTYTHKDPADRDRAMLDALKQNDVDIVVLAGYIQKISPAVLHEYEGRMINIHPALLPKYGGQGMHGHHVHEAVLHAQDQTSGVTVHLIDEFYDNGLILKQATVPVQQDDTPDTLAARVLLSEHPTLVETLQDISTGKIILPALAQKLFAHQLNS